MPVGALFKHWSMRLWAPDRVVQRTYEAFRRLLAHDAKSHELMAEFAMLYHERQVEDLARTRRRYRNFTEAVKGMVTALEQMLPGQVGTLRDYYNKYDFYLRLLLAPPESFLIPPFVVPNDQPAASELVGGKSHCLLRIREASIAQVPDGFTVTTTTFNVLLEHNGVRPAMDLLLAEVNIDSTVSLEATSQALMTLVRRLEIPEPIQQAIFAEYDRLSTQKPQVVPLVAVRSSANFEDGTFSFAGQYHSVLGVARQGLLAAYLEVLASKYTPQALRYRIEAGISDEEAAMAVLVLAMVKARASGVIYTHDPTGTNEDGLLVHAVCGLGLPLVEGTISPDVFVFSRSRYLLEKMEPGRQERALHLHDGRLEDVAYVRPTDRSLALSLEQATLLAHVARKLESYFAGPQDIEWALDEDGQVVILQSRPLVRPPAKTSSEDNPQPVPSGLPPPLLAGAVRASGGVAWGRVLHQMEEEPEQESDAGIVLVTSHIPPSLVRHLARLNAVVCEQGAVTGHFATVCREFGVVLLVQATGALASLPPHLEVTVDGDQGCVFLGRIEALTSGATAKKQLHGAWARRQRALLDYITPLHLVDPAAPEFTPQGCRSLHDIIRYAHEKAVQAMFGLGDMAGGTQSRGHRLATELPLDIYLLDVGGGVSGAAQGGEIPLEALRSQPFLALWQGLSHPEVDWSGHQHFDWQGFGDMALSGGIAAGGDRAFASYAVVGPDYCNLNVRFGFHFALVDCLCGAESRANHCHLRFAGGGGDYGGRSARISFLQGVLARLGFEVTVRGDLLDARLTGYPHEELLPLLTEVGRLLGVTKLMDMVLQAEAVAERIEQFFQTATIPPLPVPGNH